jgi:hypothetical protein
MMGGTELISTALDTRLSSSKVVRHFAAPGGVAHMHGILEIQVRGQRGQIVGIVVHIVSIGRLGRAAMAAPVVGYHPKPMLQKEQHLGIPVVGRQRPAVRKHDGLARAPVLVEYFRAVFGGECGHDVVSAVNWIRLIGASLCLRRHTMSPWITPTPPPTPR